MLLTRDDYKFEWKNIGDIELGRPNLGNTTNVAVYRLMQYTMRSVLSTNFGAETAGKLFFDSGKLAGIEFCKNLLDCNLNLNAFIAQLQDQLRSLGIGILRVEESDVTKLSFTLVVTEDLDCSGLPVTDETVCDYDEGFIAGVLYNYTGTNFDVKEVDCWSTGSRVCRFKVVPE